MATVSSRPTALALKAQLVIPPPHFAAAAKRLSNVQVVRSAKLAAALAATQPAHAALQAKLATRARAGA